MKNRAAQAAADARNRRANASRPVETLQVTTTEPETGTTAAQAMPEVETTAFGVSALGRCFLLGEEELQLLPGWTRGTNGPNAMRHDWFANNLPFFRRVAYTLPSRAVFSDDSDVVNTFLKDEGSSIKLDPCGPDEYAMAAVVEYDITWTYKGRASVVTIGGTTYKAAKLPAIQQARWVKGYEHPVAIIGGTGVGTTPDSVTVRRNGEITRITRSDEAPKPFAVKVLVTRIDESMTAFTKEALYEIVRSLYKDFQDGKKSRPIGCGGIIFPRTKLDVQPDVSWLVDLRTENANGRECRVVQAFLQKMLEMNEEGAQVKEIAAVRVAFESTGPIRYVPLIIDGPFVAAVIVTVDGKDEVVDVYRVGRSAWTAATAEDIANDAAAKETERKALEDAEQDPDDELPIAPAPTKFLFGNEPA